MSKAELIRRMTEYLDDLFIWNVEYAGEHIQNMMDIIDENW